MPSALLSLFFINFNFFHLLLAVAEQLLPGQIYYHYMLSNDASRKFKTWKEFMGRNIKCSPFNVPYTTFNYLESCKRFPSLQTPFHLQPISRHCCGSRANFPGFEINFHVIVHKRLKIYKTQKGHFERFTENGWNSLTVWKIPTGLERFRKNVHKLTGFVQWTLAFLAFESENQFRFLIELYP